ncbi:MAG: hypothetical protein EBU90_13185 [Proteobacteria bacterium]|nr:hypothetical protein [Pseudomonadota bacterium]NBP15735.1 hypothetical protein [bacterium]
MIKKQFLIFALLALNLSNNSYSAAWQSAPKALTLEYRKPKESLPFNINEIPEKHTETDLFELKKEVLPIIESFATLDPSALEPFTHNRLEKIKVSGYRIAQVGKPSFGKYSDYSKDNLHFLDASFLMNFVYQDGEYGCNTERYKKWLRYYIENFGGLAVKDRHGRNLWHHAAMRDNLNAMEVFKEFEPIDISYALMPDGQGETAETYIRKKGFNDPKTEAILAIFANIKKERNE